MVNVNEEDPYSDIKIDFQRTITNADVFALDNVTSFHTNIGVIRDLNAVARFVVKLDPAEKNTNLKSLQSAICNMLERAQLIVNGRVSDFTVDSMSAFMASPFRMVPRQPLVTIAKAKRSALS